MSDLYVACVSAGVEIDHHCSDLYIPVNDVTSKLIDEHGCLATTFKSNKPPHVMWYEIPFAYTPYWEEKAKARDTHPEKEEHE